MLRVYIDTSSLLFGFRNKHNPIEAISDEFYGAKVVVSEGVIEELKKLAESKKAIASAARVALKALQESRVEIEENREMPDKWLLKLKGRFVVVCTNDAKLKERLRKKGLRVVSMARSGKIR